MRNLLLKVLISWACFVQRATCDALIQNLHHGESAVSVVGRFGSRLPRPSTASPTTASTPAFLKTNIANSHTNAATSSTALLGMTTGVYGGQAESKKDLAIVKFYKWYTRQCNDHPFKTKSLTAATMSLLGDFTAQAMAYTQAQHMQSITLSKFVVEFFCFLNYRRQAIFFLCGLLYTAPFVHLWYDFLWKFQRRLEVSYNVTSTWMQTIYALMVDQTFGVAIFFPFYFYVYEFLDSMVSLRPFVLQRAHEKCGRELWTVLMLQYRIYPISNLINFALIPKPLRALFSSVVALLWNIYLSTTMA